MLDGFSDLAVFCVLILGVTLLLTGAAYVRDLGIRRLRRWRVGRVLHEDPVPTAPRLVSSQTRATAVTQGRHTARHLARAESLDGDSCFSTTGLSVPKDAA